MSRLSAKTIVVLAAICFLGLVVLQLAWIQSAYEGELALYTKEKRQFESEIQIQLKQHEAFKAGLKNMLDSYNQLQNVSANERTWFIAALKAAIDKVSQEKGYSVHLDNYGIAYHKHTDPATGPDFKAVALYKDQALSNVQIEKAGRLCLHCILGLPDGTHDQYSYQLMLFYGRERSTIYGKMAFLIILSFLLLLLLGLLFRQVLMKYKQERSLSEAKNDFINNLSHEVQTPVFAIQMANRIIKERYSDHSDAKHLTEIIEKETSQLKQHAGKILELASLENEQVELNLEETELNSFIEDKKLTLHLMLQSKGGEVQVNYHPGPLLVPLDRVHLNNVLVTLTENAIKYNNSAPKVVIKTGEKNGMVWLTLTDNGIGIEQQYLPYVFDKFYRVPDAKRNGTTGFGLGLSYVRQIISLHKGQININSEPGKGTSITISLPKSDQHV